ncbi:unnamed protein product [Effrenium voratum]|nr:unnamed protein product [Effrenium voratum]
MPRPDFDEEARKLFALLNLPSGAASDESSRLHGYHNLDAVWQHPTTGAQVFIGNATASSQREILRKNRVTHIVNCTSDMSNTFDGDPAVAYFRFDIYKFFSALDLRSHRGVLEFFLPVFQWIDEAVSSGHSVLIHCLAGAHRAGPRCGLCYACSRFGSPNCHRGLQALPASGGPHRRSHNSFGAARCRSPGEEEVTQCHANSTCRRSVEGFPLQRFPATRTDHGGNKC